jgi:hypothetical protein
MLKHNRKTASHVVQARSLRPLGGVATVLLALLLVACSGSAGAAAPGTAAPTQQAAGPSVLPSAAPTTSQAAAAIPLPDACTLVTAANVAGIIGQPVSAQANSDAIIDPSVQSACDYVVANGSSGAIKLFVADPGTLAGIVANLPVEAVDGLGDAAYQWDIGTTHTLAAAVGPVVFQVLLSTKFYDPSAARSMLDIAIANLGN